MAIKGRSTVYNKIVTEEKKSLINKNNIELMEDFLDYLQSIGRSSETLSAYRNDLYIYFVLVLDILGNKDFIYITKREFAKIQSYCINQLEWSSSRVRRVKSTVSSMSNFITDILDEEEKYKDFKKTINKIESPVKEPVREKTVLTDEQIQFLLDTLIEKKQYQKACVLSLAACCGARKSELTRFKVDYFKEDNIIFNAVYKTPEKIKTKGRGKGKFLHKYILLEFKNYFDLWMKERERLGIDSEWLFVTKDGEEYKQATITLMDSYADSFSKILNIPFYFHSVRHYVITKFRKLNLPSNVIVEWTGWNDESMISVYDDSEAIDDFGKYFSADGIVSQEQKSLSDL